MKILGIFLLLNCFFILTIAGQTAKECRKLLKKEIGLSALENGGKDFQTDFKLLIDCEFEPIDYQIFLGPQKEMSFISTLVLMQTINAVETKDKFTFEHLKLLIEGFKSSPEYFKVRDIVEATNNLMIKNISVQDWSIDSVLLKRMNYDYPTISKIKILVQENEQDNITYLNLLQKNAEIIFPKAEVEIHKTEKPVLPENMSACVKGLNAYNNYQFGKQKSIEKDKSVLLYFTGHGCTNSRELENKVLIDSEIQKNINEEYIFVQLYVDDKTPLALSEVHFSETLKRNLKYKGDIDAEIQLKEFNSQAQPLFVLLDKDFREISRIGYVGSVEEFRQFLSGQENK